MLIFTEWFSLSQRNFLDTYFQYTCFNITIKHIQFEIMISFTHHPFNKNIVFHNKNVMYCWDPAMRNQWWPSGVGVLF